MFCVCAANTPPAYLCVPPGRGGMLSGACGDSRGQLAGWQMEPALGPWTQAPGKL